MHDNTRWCKMGDEGKKRKEMLASALRRLGLCENFHLAVKGYFGTKFNAKSDKDFCTLQSNQPAMDPVILDNLQFISLYKTSLLVS